MDPVDDVVRYFEAAGPDYAAWSAQFNMHFGYWVRGMNPFRREPMLESMNERTWERLGSERAALEHVADLGCGLGATARYIARRSPSTHIIGFTIVPWQVANGNRMSAEQGCSARVSLVLSDYRSTPCESASMDAAYALESACYAGGPDKADLVGEMARILKPGGRVVVSDGFRKHSRPMNPLLRRVYRIACRSWALQEMADIERFTAALRSAGFVEVIVEEISWRVAPSFAHVPFLCVQFALERLLKGELRWKRERWQNLMGPLFGSLLGLHRSQFGYYLVSAVRRAVPAGDVDRGGARGEGAS